MTFAHVRVEHLLAAFLGAVQPYAQTAKSLLDRFAKCLERLQTPYVDALYIHAANNLAEVKHAGFHEAAAKLKADGKLRHLGISSHGPRKEGDSMEKVLLAAVEDGRFDLMLLVYSFMKKEEGARVLTACKEKDVGACIMKASPGVLKVDAFDPENPVGEYAEYMKKIMGRGKTRAEAVKGIQAWVDEQKKSLEPTRAFLAEYGIQTEAELQDKSIRWVLDNPLAHTICVSMKNFDLLDRTIPLSGSKLSLADSRLLNAWAQAIDSRYCRHGCTECAAACPHGLPVSTIMRYASYFANQGREKQAMQKYARLADSGASTCLTCHAPCQGACPHGLPIQANLVRADNLLGLA
jgi:predicted aldo/keto reductase-like oxidoreductase